jgi:hypothetical protein
MLFCRDAQNLPAHRCRTRTGGAARTADRFSRRFPTVAAFPAACGDCAEMQVRVDVPPYCPSMELRYRLVLAALFVALVGVMVFLFTYAPPGPGVTD